MRVERISRLAFYVTSRKRSELMELDSERLEAILRALFRRRLVARFGSWRSSQKSGAGR